MVHGRTGTGESKSGRAGLVAPRRSETCSLRHLRSRWGRGTRHARPMQAATALCEERGGAAGGQGAASRADGVACSRVLPHGRRARRRGRVAGSHGPRRAGVVGMSVTSEQNGERDEGTCAGVQRRWGRASSDPGRRWRLGTSRPGRRRARRNAPRGGGVAVGGSTAAGEMR